MADTFTPLQMNTVLIGLERPILANRLLWFALALAVLAFTHVRFRLGQHSGIAQPRLTATTLRVEIYPERQAAQIRGTYHLLNDSAVAIDAIHLTTAPEVLTRAVSFDRRIARALEDETLHYWIYTLEQPLRPGETVQLTFEIDFEPHGFTNDGAESFVVANGTYLTSRDWLPAIGYQRNREIDAVRVRRQLGLPPRPAFRRSRTRRRAGSGPAATPSRSKPS